MMYTNEMNSLGTCQEPQWYVFEFTECSCHFGVFYVGHLPVTV